LDLAKCFPIIEDIDEAPVKKEKHKKGKGKKKVEKHEGGENGS
jgi:hypothetical protein